MRPFKRECLPHPSPRYCCILRLFLHTTHDHTHTTGAPREHAVLSIEDGAKSLLFLSQMSSFSSALRIRVRDLVFEFEISYFHCRAHGGNFGVGGRRGGYYRSVVEMVSRRKLSPLQGTGRARAAVSIPPSFALGSWLRLLCVWGLSTGPTQTPHTS